VCPCEKNSTRCSVCVQHLFYPTRFLRISRPLRTQECIACMDADVIAFQECLTGRCPSLSLWTSSKIVARRSAQPHLLCSTEGCMALNTLQSRKRRSWCLWLRLAHLLTGEGKAFAQQPLKTCYFGLSIQASLDRTKCWWARSTNCTSAVQRC
jgi:hypothetical protein